jgi:hypothetical protein
VVAIFVAPTDRQFTPLRIDEKSIVLTAVDTNVKVDWNTLSKHIRIRPGSNGIPCSRIPGIGCDSFMLTADAILDMFTTTPRKLDIQMDFSVGDNRLTGSHFIQQWHSSVHTNRAHTRSAAYEAGSLTVLALFLFFMCIVFALMARFSAIE